MDTLLTVEDVAARLQVPKSWVYLRSEAGDLPSLKVGRYLRFAPADVERWIAAQGSKAGRVVP